MRTRSTDVANVVRLELGRLLVKHTFYHVELLFRLHKLNKSFQLLVLDFTFVQVEDLHEHRV